MVKLLDRSRLTIEGGCGVHKLDPSDGPGVRMFRYVGPGQWPQTMGGDALANKSFEEFFAFVRVLPYDDYSRVREDELTFELIYKEIFRYYARILPAMSKRLDMADPTIWRTPTAARYLDEGRAQTLPAL